MHIPLHFRLQRIEDRVAERAWRNNGMSPAVLCCFKMPARELYRSLFVSCCGVEAAAFCSPTVINGFAAKNAVYLFDCSSVS